MSNSETMNKTKQICLSISCPVFGLFRYVIYLDMGYVHISVEPHTDCSHIQMNCTNIPNLFQTNQTCKLWTHPCSCDFSIHLTMLTSFTMTVDYSVRPTEIKTHDDCDDNVTAQLHHYISTESKPKNLNLHQTLFPLPPFKLKCFLQEM